MFSNETKSENEPVDSIGHYPLCEYFDSRPCNCEGTGKVAETDRHFRMCEHFDGLPCNCGGKPTDTGPDIQDRLALELKASSVYSVTPEALERRMSSGIYEDCKDRRESLNNNESEIAIFRARLESAAGLKGRPSHFDSQDRRDNLSALKGPGDESPKKKRERKDSIRPGSDIPVIFERVLSQNISESVSPNIVRAASVSPLSNTGSVQLAKRPESICGLPTAMAGNISPRMPELIVANVMHESLASVASLESMNAVTGIDSWSPIKRSESERPIKRRDSGAGPIKSSGSYSPLRSPRKGQDRFDSSFLQIAIPEDPAEEESVSIENVNVPGSLCVLNVHGSDVGIDDKNGGLSTDMEASEECGSEQQTTFSPTYTKSRELRVSFSKDLVNAADDKDSVGSADNIPPWEFDDEDGANPITKADLERDIAQTISEYREFDASIDIDNDACELDDSLGSDIGHPRWNSSFKEDNSFLSQMSHSSRDPLGGGDALPSAILTRRSPFREVGFSFDESIASNESDTFCDVSTYVELSDASKCVSFYQDNHSVSLTDCVDEFN